MSSKKNSSKAAGGAKSSSASNKEAADAQPVVTRVVVKGVDMGQGKVLPDNAGFFRKSYYRYTLMTGVYMLDPMEQALLHFFMFLGAFFALRYSYAFYVAMQDRK